LSETTSQRKANTKYKTEKVKQIKINIFPKDRDVYEYINSKQRKSEYIIKLIRDDMNRS